METEALPTSPASTLVLALLPLPTCLPLASERVNLAQKLAAALPSLTTVAEAWSTAEAAESPRPVWARCCTAPVMLA